MSKLGEARFEGDSFFDFTNALCELAKTYIQLISRERPGQGATHSSTEARTLSRAVLRLEPRPRPNFGAGALYDRPRGTTFNSPPTTRFKTTEHVTARSRHLDMAIWIWGPTQK